MSGAGRVETPDPANVDAAHVDGAHVQLVLFVTGASDRSARAIADAHALGEVHLQGDYELRVLDLLLDVDEVRAHRVLAAPTLIKFRPAPERRFVGDLADAVRVLVALGLQTDDGGDAVVG